MTIQDIEPRGKIVGVYVRWPSKNKHQYDKLVILPKPNRHHNCIHIGSKELGYGPQRGDSNWDEGFVTENGRLLSRKQAKFYAENIGQLNVNKMINKDILTSEDLW